MVRDDRGASVISSALKHNQTLQILDLSDISLSDEETIEIASCLHQSNITELNLNCKSSLIFLKVLFLRYTLLGNDFKDVGAKAIAESLKESTRLRTLHLQGNGNI
jgi:hypothetical protein